MNDSNRASKWIFVLVLVVLALALLYPPSEKLKGGIDLVGGTRLLYEIDTSGLDPDQQAGLSTRVMEILKDRVDPGGQLNLEWRPVGNTRLEIRMPRPPKKALERRAAYESALDALDAKNFARYDVEQALHATDVDRATVTDKLQHGVPVRKQLIADLVKAYAAMSAGEAQETSDGQTSLEDRYETAMSELLASCFPVERFADLLDLPATEQRDTAIADIRTEFASFDEGSEADADGKLITKAMAAHEAWAANKADLEDPSDLKRRLRGAGVLEFRILADRDPSSPSFTHVPDSPGLRHSIDRYVTQLKEFGPRPRAEDRYGWFPIDDVVRFMRLDKIGDFQAQKNDPSQPIVEEYVGRHYVLAHSDPEYGLLQRRGKQTWKLKSAFPDVDMSTGRNVVSFQLDPRGGQFFGDLTAGNLNRSLCIMLDDTAMSHANIISRITEWGQISGRFTTEQVQNMVRIFEAGSLPARLRDRPLMENTIGPSLGETNRTKGIQAAKWGCASVALFVLFYYGIAAGGIANIALALNLLFVLAIMAMLQATFTLPGIAGLILTVGIAIDANVLIFERIREERDRGVVFKRALNAGYDKAFSTIVDANLTTLLTCVILGFVGSEEVKGFAITLGIGIVTSMFTSLFVTRLIFNTLIAKGMLKDLSMRRIIGKPSIDWLALRRTFWPVSIVAVVGGLGLFIGRSVTAPQAMYDIEFLGGTMLQIDLKPGVSFTDEEMTAAITDEENSASATAWLRRAADQLLAAGVAEGGIPGQFTLSSKDLTGDQLAILMRTTIEDKVVRGGIRPSGRSVVIDGEAGKLTPASFSEARDQAAEYARGAAGRLAGARVQSVGELSPEAKDGSSFEITTVETNRELVQAAVLATFGDKLVVQRAITFTTVVDTELTQEPYFVVESGDHFLSDVIGGDAAFDIRRFRGGVAVVVELDDREQAIAKAELDKRLQEVGLLPEFEQYHRRESQIFPLGNVTKLDDGASGYRRFAILAHDDAVLYDEDPIQWAETLAMTQLGQVEVALGQEKSLSKVLQFAAPIAKQTRNRAMFAIVLALAGIISYLWLRFGTKEYGLAASVAVVHDVAITLGLVTLTQFVYKSFIGTALLIDPLRIDLAMIAAVMTVIGYSLNDTIVVFDRIRENKGRVESLNPNIINNSINQTLSRTVLTSFTTFLVVAILYVFGGKGVHGFSFALIIGVLVGTYSSIGIAAPLLYRPRLLHAVVTVIAAMGMIGIVFAATGDQQTIRLVLIGLTAAIGLWILAKTLRDEGYSESGQPVGA